MLPFLLQPVCKDYLWGGQRLKSEFGKQSPQQIVAESWELSAHPDGESIVASGANIGMPFGTLLEKHPEITGTNNQNRADFPILIKLIDAEQSLSIQVHPEDEYARRVEHEAGKTEMWMVLDSKPDSFIYFGFTQEITKDEMRRRIEDNTLTEVLCRIPAEKGTVVYIPAGTIHAIGAGIVLAEVQQSSNSTYRVYDFGRRGPDGKLRELHVDKALDVTHLYPANPAAPGAEPDKKVEGGHIQRLASSEYFTVDRLRLDGSYTCTVREDSFVSVLCTEGFAVLKEQQQNLNLSKGSSVFVPAGDKTFLLQGTGEFLLTRV